MRLELRPSDLGCLDLISRHGPISPSALARPASSTGSSAAAGSNVAVTRPTAAALSSRWPGAGAALPPIKVGHSPEIIAITTPSRPSSNPADDV